MLSSYFDIANPVSATFILASVLLMGGALLPLLLHRYHATAHATGMVLSVVGSLVGIYSSILALCAKSPSTFSIPWVTAGINLSFNIDSLAAFFLLPIFVLGCLCALYGYSYLSHDLHKTGKIALHWFFFNILMLSMIAVVTAGNGLQFLISWEGMSISSFFLVCYDYEKDEVRQAGWLYFMATHIGVAFLFLFFLISAVQTGSLDFTSFSNLRTVSPAMTGGLFVLILLGFGSKAGLFPMHIWLPEAHPAAPSHVSALMSGVMIKTAVYGFLRMVTFLPPLPQWCIIIILATGLIGAIFGISMAASQNDIKRSLAYSSVENINLIFLGIGLWLLGTASGWPVMAGIALTGALLHIWNHALFKGLLFMGAGSVLHSTGSRFLSRHGGLLRRMPVTGTMLIAGSIAISGLPPFNGFISELYLYMSVVVMGQQANGITAFSALLILSLMILVGGLVLFTVSRLSGMALLGEPRAVESEQAVESGPLMLIPMLILAFLCLLFGVYPTLPLSAVVPPLKVLSALPDSSQHIVPFLFSKEWTIASIVLFSLCMFLIWIRTKKSASASRSATWGCGFQKPNKRMVYSAGGFSQLAQDTWFYNALVPKSEWQAPKGIFSNPVSFVQKISDPVFQNIFMPFFANLSSRAISFRRLQAGKLNIYILYMFIATILLLGLDVFQNS
jgi:formate hydrogenlyase subunit 3/multisubunit Na+/H+ antiporter MnhD subunit